MSFETSSKTNIFQTGAACVGEGERELEAERANNESSGLRSARRAAFWAPCIESDMSPTKHSTTTNPPQLMSRFLPTFSSRAQPIHDESEFRGSDGASPPRGVAASSSPHFTTPSPSSSNRRNQTYDRDRYLRHPFLLNVHIILMPAF